MRIPKPWGRKYNNIPTRSPHTGILYQSKKEASREPVLLALEAAGEIADVRRQVPFSLEVYNTDEVAVLLHAIGAGDLAEVGRAAERVAKARHKICRYVADFTYATKAGALVVEDVKGYPTPVYSLKKKLMLACLGIEIVEPNDRGVQQRARGAGITGRGTGSRLRGGGAR